jgi:outer membrane protein assembly factor BamB
VANFGFEAQPLVHGRLLLCGAWDGKLHALDRHHGNLVWSAWSATCQAEFETRYYGPADGTPIISGDDVLAADRGWRLGRFALDGRLRGVVRGQVSAVGASRDGTAFFTRGLDHRLAKYSAAGALLWETETPLGRAPSPPVEQNGDVAAVSDTGLFTLVDSATGEKRFAVSISPSLYVLSGIGVDGGHRFFAADMDGRLTCVSLVG